MVFLGGDGERIEKNRQTLGKSVLEEAIGGEVEDNQVEKAVVKVFMLDGDSLQQEELRESLDNGGSDLFFVYLSGIIRGGVAIVNELEAVLKLDHFLEIGVAVEFQQEDEQLHELSVAHFAFYFRQSPPYRQIE